MKPVADCENLQDIRAGIDALDYQLVQLLTHRLNYVLAAAQYKPDAASIPAPDRVASMLIARRQWAVELGLEPQFVIDFFQQIIPWFITTQTRHWQAVNTEAGK